MRGVCRCLVLLEAGLLGGLPAWGEGPRWDNEAVRGAGLAAFPYQVEEAFAADAFREPVMVVPYQGEGGLWLAVLGRKGTIWSVADQGAAEPVVSCELAERLAGAEGAGGLGLTLMGGLFDRDFPRRPYLYLRYSVRGHAPPMNRLTRFEVTGTNPLQLGRGEEILEWESNGHDGGDLKWGPRDGYLYVTAGDGSAPGDPDNIGQQTDKIRGSILRIDVHAEPGGKPYRIPEDNPFVGQEGVRPELWCYGLRNPWRMSFHPGSGELWLGDNGDEHWELVQRIVRGANYGWSAYEGSHVFRAGNPLAGPSRTHTPPLVEHPHSEMRSIIGGLFYRGEALPGLRGHYLYGCYFTKRVWAVAYRDGEAGEPVEIADAGGAVVSFDERPDGEFYLTCLDGPIYRLRRSEDGARGRPWPRHLSETGLFRDAARGLPAPGVLPYQVNGAAWYDGADVQRFLAIPEGERIRQNGGMQLAKCWVLPEGSALAQTISLQGRKVETRMLYFDGQWRGFTYRWHDDQSDAELVGEEGLDAQVMLPDGSNQPWRFHSRAECMTCHTQRSNFAIGLATSQLDRPGPDGGNQIDRLLEGGYLANSPSLRQLRGHPFPDPYDEALPVAERARAYLDLNCAHCHRETGLGGRAGFELMAGLPLEQTGIVNTRAVVGLALGPESVLVAPGAPERSELLARMARRGPGQMPLIGSHCIDPRGVDLIRRWIRELPPTEDQ